MLVGQWRVNQLYSASRITRRLISRSCFNLHEIKEGCHNNNELKKFKYADTKYSGFSISRYIDHVTDPLDKAKNAFLHDFRCMKAAWKGTKQPIVLPTSDILVIGGGIVGASIAFHLKERVNRGANILIVEKDLPNLSSSLAVGANGLYHQIPSKQRAEFAQYAADLYRHLTSSFSDPDIPTENINFTPSNSLLLASGKGIDALEELSAMYHELKWAHTLLSPQMLQARYPWMNTEGVALASLGLNKEGLFNQWSVVSALRKRAEARGAVFMQGKVAGFQFQNVGEPTGHMYRPASAMVVNPEGEAANYNFGYLVIAAGAGLKDIEPLLNAGYIRHNLHTAARKQFLYNIQCPDGPGIDMPMVMDPSGLRFRRVGLLDDYLVWQENGSESNDTMDAESVYKEKIYPSLVNRAPIFRDAKVSFSSEGLIDCNTWDQNLLVGQLPYFPNVYIVSGFHNDEFLYAPAIGKAIAEEIIDGICSSLNISHYSFMRIEMDEKIKNVSIN